MHEYTEFCISELRKCLRSRCPEFEWANLEETIEGKDFRTQIDVCGKTDKRQVLIQFEMRRESGLTNAVKARYCLEGKSFTKEEKILILHIFSPFSEKPEKGSDMIEDIDVPEGIDKEDYLRFKEKKETRPPARRNAYVHRLLCQFVQTKGWLDSENITYRVMPWDLSGLPEVRKAFIVLPKGENEFPKETSTAIANLTNQIRIEIDKW